ncbi:MAG: hypothetical protein A2487_05260 [Candidatus Raymondbacteria bacterium RifOxyC12_full_50_8]|uniref:Response regulatory domain-containing protein n=1 Tax=Candidatus Raymondbacteria bacterium RIFOXYD12_FULL_49_13 TaxID=1817890 RepID=A0A1F7FAV3_UNCRA|nr:MAG: hypothetical protein A2350_20320 [Candidatus Raymondbacteria bacterium RifOxyB12_full_50_8]OGJ92352.1 MAG: hypothetical protein A2248_10380 [Candidatus Raymondbacteria bacterium RIFOXYA2_FULL_49_16]OGJ94978.1 MAG: hypothetical protein A2487_05260 [Candidatus Raymondbacteria bacterium RifOxyC12_full_50_8]OGJ99333.1 MAG: hypothetical protein A2453_13440 [Candidatus Raymondbacteria bacterium RIFOXYC2_FULL_50_21]OGK03652.1 MAG: hypothetical protein A2519_02685 [Candidatus Raymondbacteria ba
MNSVSTCIEDETKFIIPAKIDLNVDIRSALIIDDEEIVCSLIGESLEQSELNVLAICSRSPEIGYELCKKYSFDLLVCDISMPKIKGNTIGNL